MSLPYESPRPIVSDNVLAIAIYVLYGVSYFVGG